MDWKEKCFKGAGKWDYYPADLKKFMDEYRNRMRVATVHETMGPNWKPIVWVKNRPYVFK